MIKEVLDDNDYFKGLIQKMETKETKTKTAKCAGNISELLKRMEALENSFVSLVNTTTSLAEAIKGFKTDNEARTKFNDTMLNGLQKALQDVYKELSNVHMVKVQLTK